METATIDMTKLRNVDYIKHYIGRECMVFDPNNILSGTIEQIDLEDDSVLVNTGEKSTWVKAEYVKPEYKKFSDLDQDDLDTLINHMVINSVTQKAEDFTIGKKTSSFIILHCEKFNICIRSNWGIFTQGVEGSIASTIDNTGQIVFLLCEMNYDVARVFE